MFKWTSWLVRVNFRQVSLRLTTTFKAHRTAGFFKHSTLVLFWWSGTWRCLHDKKKFSQISIKIEAETRSRRCSDSRWKKIHPTGDHSIVVSMLRPSHVLVFTLCGLPISFARWLICLPWSSWHWRSKFCGKRGEIIKNILNLVKLIVGWKFLGFPDFPNSNQVGNFPNQKTSFQANFLGQPSMFDNKKSFFGINVNFFLQSNVVKWKFRLSVKFDITLNFLQLVEQFSEHKLVSG